MLTYLEYLEKGGILEQTAFYKIIDLAWSTLQEATHGRIDNISVLPDVVKACCRDLCELYSNFSKTRGISSVSQSAGAASESVSYRDISSEDTDYEIDSLIYKYLSKVKDDNGTPLLYRGALI